jgi:predicted membrane protein
MPFPAKLNVPPMKEPKEFDYFKAWLLFFLIATVGGGIIGMIVGSFVAAFLGAGGMPLAQMTRILQIIGPVIGIPISYFTFRAVVGKYLFPKIEDDTPPRD